VNPPQDPRWERACARLGTAYPEVQLVPWPPRDEGWLTARALGTDPTAFARLVDLEVAHIRADWQAEPRPYVAATWALLHYGWYAAFAVAGPYLAGGLVPGLDVDGFGLRLAGPGRPVTELAVRPRGHTDAAADADPARAELRRVHALLVAPVFTAGARLARRSPVALWRAAADTLAGALWRIGERLGDERGGAAEAVRVLGDAADGTGPIRPYAGCANFRELTLPSGARRLTRKRNDCCLAYTLGQGTPCVTCPRLTDGERVGLIS